MQLSESITRFLLTIVTTGFLLVNTEQLHAEGALEKVRKNLDTVSESLDKARNKVDDARQNLDENIDEIDSLVDEAESIKEDATTLIEDLKNSETQKALAAEALARKINSNASQTTKESRTLARSVNGNLTQDSINAYTEALQFCLAQVGRNVRFSPQERSDIRQALVNAYSTLDAKSQRRLADARSTWNYYRTHWKTLPIQVKQSYAYDVIALAYGEEDAAQALGMNQGIDKKNAPGDYR